MKFSEIMREQWEELQPYLDTCLLPLSGLKGGESPWEAGEKLEELRDALDLVEIPFVGRTVTYPAFHYGPGDSQDERWSVLLAEACSQLKKSGFRFVVLVTALSSEVLPDALLGSAGADLVLRYPRARLTELPAESKAEAAVKLTGMRSGSQST